MSLKPLENIELSDWLHKKHNIENGLIRKYGKTPEYQPPVKTISDYESEIRNLEREIEIAKDKINKLKLPPPIN